MLSRIVAECPAATHFAGPLVGTETADDAAVFQINDRQVVVATTDFFMPIADDPFDFDRIAATNALAVLGMPIDKLPVETVREIVAGGTSVCAAAGIPVADGHSIDSPEPIYGLVVLELVDQAHLLRNSAARAGDRLILTKRLGIGIFSAALKKGLPDESSYADMLRSTTQLNAVGAE